MQLSPGAVRIRDLTVRYRQRTALRGVDLDLTPGRLCALIGPNGAGKTTLLRAIAGLLPHDGTVELGTAPNGPECALAYVPQRLGFDPAFPITAHRLVTSGRRRQLGMWRRPTTADRVAVAAALERVGLAGVGGRLVGELSGGQLQRVVLARALAQDAGVLLLDEPLSGVDVPTRAELLDLLADLAADGRTVVVSTHDLGLVRRHFDRMIAVNGHVLVDAPAADGFDTPTLERVFATPDPVPA